MVSHMFFPVGWERWPRHDILKGPDKWDLIDAFAGGNSEKRRKIFFRLKEGGTVEKIIITGLMWEDGSGHSFLFSGFQEGGIQGRFVFGYYNTKTGKGWIGCVTPLDISGVTNSQYNRILKD